MPNATPRGSFEEAGDDGYHCAIELFNDVPIFTILVFAKVVEMEPVTTDHDGGTLAVVKVGDTVVNEELIRRGLARVFTRYCDRAICERWDGKL